MRPALFYPHNNSIMDEETTVMPEVEETEKPCTGTPEATEEGAEKPCTGTPEATEEA